MVLLICRPILP